MSLRLKKQLWRKGPGGDKDWIPGPGQYKHTTSKDIGNTRSRLQEWKTPLRKTDWCILKTDAADKVDNLMDYKGLSATMQKSEQRLKTTMGSSVPRSPATCDSRRPQEKLNVKLFEVTGPVSTPETLGPGSYRSERSTDIGRDKRNFQAWRTPLRRTRWWYRQSDAPEDLYSADLMMLPSKSIIGGRHSTAWPLPEDEDGNPILTSLTSPRSMLGSGHSKRPAKRGIQSA